MVSINMWTVVGKRLRIIGTGGGSVSPEELDHLIELVATGALRGPVIDRELPTVHQLTSGFQRRQGLPENRVPWR